MRAPIIAIIGLIGFPNCQLKDRKRTYMPKELVNRRIDHPLLVTEWMHP